MGMNDNGWFTWPTNKRERMTITLQSVYTKRSFSSTTTTNNNIDYTKCTISELQELLKKRGIVKTAQKGKHDMVQELKILDLLRVYEGHKGYQDKHEEDGMQNTNKKIGKRQRTLQRVLKVVQKYGPIEIDSGNMEAFQQAYWVEYRERWKVRASYKNIGYKNFKSLIRAIPEIKSTTTNKKNRPITVLSIHPEYVTSNNDKKETKSSSSSSSSSSLPKPDTIRREEISTFGDSSQTQKKTVSSEGGGEKRSVRRPPPRPKIKSLSS
jgi:hypothetical protein